MHRMSFANGFFPYHINHNKNSIRTICFKREAFKPWVVVVVVNTALLAQLLAQCVCFCIFGHKI